MVAVFKRITESETFHNWILALILLSGVLVGVETYPQFGPDTVVGEVIQIIQYVILCFFVVEIVIKIGAFGSQPWRYFLNPWNLFDFTIVAVCFLPFSKFAMVLRMARLLRALRLLSVVPKMQVLANALLKSIPSLGYVGILLLLHFYIYAVLGTVLFSQNDPIRFGRLQHSMTTLFQVLTLEGWNDVFNTQLLGSDVTYDDAMKNLPIARGRVNTPHPIAARAYFISFIMLGTMIMLNLFTGVIINAMQESQVEAPVGDPDASLIHKIEKRGFVTLRDELELIGMHLRSVAADVSALKEHTGLLGHEPTAPKLADGPDSLSEPFQQGAKKDLRRDELQRTTGN